MLTAQWILEITDTLMYKIFSFINVSVIQKKLRGFAVQFFLPPPNPQNVPTALQAAGQVLAGQRRYTSGGPTGQKMTYTLGQVLAGFRPGVCPFSDRQSLGPKGRRMSTLRRDRTNGN